MFARRPYPKAAEPADVDRAIAIARQVGGLEQAGGHAWPEHLPVPRPVILPCDFRCVFALQDPADTLLHRPKGLEVTPRCHGVAPLAVLIMSVGIPHADTYALNQFR